jgi:hypothetical protein
MAAYKFTTYAEFSAAIVASGGTIIAGSGTSSQIFTYPFLNRGIQVDINSAMAIGTVSGSTLTSAVNIWSNSLSFNKGYIVVGPDYFFVSIPENISISPTHQNFGFVSATNVSGVCVATGLETMFAGGRSYKSTRMDSGGNAIILPIIISGNTNGQINDNQGYLWKTSLFQYKYSTSNRIVTEHPNNIKTVRKAQESISANGGIKDNKQMFFFGDDIIHNGYGGCLLLLGGAI